MKRTITILLVGAAIGLGGLAQASERNQSLPDAHLNMSRVESAFCHVVAESAATLRPVADDFEPAYEYAFDACEQAIALDCLGDP